MRRFRSLQAKYMFIILVAISLVFFIQMSTVTIFYIFDEMIGKGHSDPEMDYELIEKNWHLEANEINNISQDVIRKHFAKWKVQLPEASMFWVDGKGTLKEQLDAAPDLPAEWSSAYTAKYIKERYGGDPFTVIAFLGNNEANGFIVIEIPRTVFESPLQNLYNEFGNILMAIIFITVLIFIAVSYLFFRGIRRRLLSLEEAMSIRDVDGLPLLIDVKKNDEIGQLEESFNQMVEELRESREREKEEEHLRQELIASLSHDLRTPLTKVQAQVYSIRKEELSDEGKEAVKALEESVVTIDRLIENLMSYTLLMAKKYKYDPKQIDIVRFIRESLASWYPAFEKEGFTVDVELEPFAKQNWLADPLWLGRIFDNLLQNVLRHGNEGKFLKVKTESTDAYDAIVIIDKGKGMGHQSNQKGAGIGLSIVDLMVKGMNLDWKIQSNEQGTVVKIINYK